MNIQAMMKQAQKLQKDMTDAKKEINEMIFTGKSSIVEVKMSGDKQLQNVKINTEEVLKDEIEMLQDMVMIAVNDALSKIDIETENKLGKFTQGMPGLF